jgi:hypothetical protein
MVMVLSLRSPPSLPVAVRAQWNTSVEHRHFRVPGLRFQFMCAIAQVLKRPAIPSLVVAPLTLRGIRYRGDSDVTVLVVRDSEPEWVITGAAVAAASTGVVAFAISRVRGRTYAFLSTRTS